MVPSPPIATILLMAPPRSAARTSAVAWPRPAGLKRDPRNADRRRPAGARSASIRAACGRCRSAEFDDDERAHARPRAWRTVPASAAILAPPRRASSQPSFRAHDLRRGCQRLRGRRARPGPCKVPARITTIRQRQRPSPRAPRTALAAPDCRRRHRPAGAAPAGCSLPPAQCPGRRVPYI